MAEFKGPKVQHYNDADIQPIDLIRSRQLTFAEGNIVKYICRYKKKDGIKDLVKIGDYLSWVIADYEKELRAKEMVAKEMEENK